MLSYALDILIGEAGLRSEWLVAVAVLAGEAALAV